MDESNYRLRCGWFKFRPNCLQRFLKPEWALFFISLAVFFQGFTVNGILHIDIPVLEFRFNLKSRGSGFISGSYNLASVLFLIPVTYFGSKKTASKPKWYGSGMILMGIGSFIFVIPELIAASRVVVSLDDKPPLCNISSTKLSDICGQQKHKLSPVIWIFAFASLIFGAGASALYTLAVTYIEEGVTTARSAIFLGIFYITVIIGSAAGFVAGGLLLRINSDYFFGKCSEILRSPDDHTHVGAWWLGFLMSGFVFIFIAIPNLAFPAELPDTPHIRETKLSESRVNTRNTGDYSSKENIPEQMCNVLRNPTFVFLTLAGCLDSAIVHSTSTFMSKILEIQFHLSEKIVPVVMGVTTVFGAVCGTILGGFILMRYKLNCNRTLKLCMSTSVLGIICSSCFLLHCKETSFVGINVPYNDRTKNLKSNCNDKCLCHEEIYSPVCGSNGLSYYSPCFAGCLAFQENKGFNEFYNCSCISLNYDRVSNEPDAKSNTCVTKCEKKFIVFFIFSTFSVFFIFATLVPGLSASLRCVRRNEKTMAMGIQWLLIRLWGVFGPSIFGSVLDLSCIKWKKTCTEEGACILYNNKSFSRNLFIVGMSLKLCGFFSLMISLLTYKRRDTT